MKHASVSAISLRHIFASPGYAPGSIVVNVTWMKKKEDSMLIKRITACTHLSLTIYELLRDIGQKLQLFPTPLHLMPPLGVFPLEFQEKVWSSEN